MVLVHPRKQCVSVHIIYGSVVPIRLAHIIEGRRILSAVFQGIDALEKDDVLVAIGSNASISKLEDMAGR